MPSILLLLFVDSIMIIQHCYKQLIIDVAEKVMHIEDKPFWVLSQVLSKYKDFEKNKQCFIAKAFTYQGHLYLGHRSTQAGVE